MWPIVGGVVVAALAILYRLQQRNAREQAQHEQARDLREIEERQRRELGEEPRSRSSSIMDAAGEQRSA